MSIHGNLLHNMSAPPKSIVRYEGLSGMATQGSPGGSGLISVAFREKNLFGTAIRFDLPPDWIGLTPLELLARLQIDADSLSCGERSGADPARRLAVWLNRRASELPLPDGCAVIPVRANHRALWSDVLTVLVFRHSTDITNKGRELPAIHVVPNRAPKVPPGCGRMTIRVRCGTYT